MRVKADGGAIISADYRSNVRPFFQIGDELKARVIDGSAGPVQGLDAHVIAAKGRDGEISAPTQIDQNMEIIQKNQAFAQKSKLEQAWTRCSNRCFEHCSFATFKVIYIISVN